MWDHNLIFIVWSNLVLVLKFNDGNEIGMVMKLEDWINVQTFTQYFSYTVLKHSSFLS